MSSLAAEKKLPCPQISLYNPHLILHAICEGEEAITLTKYPLCCIISPLTALEFFSKT